MFIHITFGQDIEFEKLTNDEYEIINSLYGSNNKIKMFHTTNPDKAWLNYFQEDENSLIKKNELGLGTVISYEELKTLFDKAFEDKISSERIFHLPIKLKANKLNGAKLVKCLPCDDNYLQTIIINKPIVVNSSLAILRKIGYNEDVIHILEKKGDSWEIIYNIWERVVLE